jgi:hypothetical protein
MTPHQAAINGCATAVFLVAGATLVAQPQTQTTEADPVQCWWRTSAGAVRVGETFTLVLTCAALETDEVKVVVDQSKLEPSVVQFAPFEVTGGSHAADLRSGDRRFFQYEYRLREIAENLFGKDVQLPETKVSYRVQSRTGQGASTSGDGPRAVIEGRDQTYVMPAQSIRILSLVPGDASDIRDAAHETFGDVDLRSFRANFLTVVGGILFAIAALLGVFAIVRLVAKYARPATAADRLMPDLAILRGVGRELSSVQKERRQAGWSAELAGRALAALRVLGTYAIGRRVSRTARSLGSAAQAQEEGSLVLRTGWPRGKRVVVSGAATTQAVARELKRVSANGGARHAADLEALEQALARFTAAQYGRNGSLDEAALDDSLTTGFHLLRRLKLRHTWPMRRFMRRHAPAGVESRVWSR